MTKDEAYLEMLSGKKVRHEYYSKNEFVFINKQGELETEDMVTHGRKHDDFWYIYQKWQEGWGVYEDDESVNNAIKMMNFLNHHTRANVKQVLNYRLKKEDDDDGCSGEHFIVTCLVSADENSNPVHKDCLVSVSQFRAFCGDENAVKWV